MTVVKLPFRLPAALCYNKGKSGPGSAGHALAPRSGLGGHKRMRGLLNKLDVLTNPALTSGKRPRAGWPSVSPEPPETLFFSPKAFIVAAVLVVAATAPPALAQKPPDEPSQPSQPAGEPDGEKTAENSLVLVEGQVTDHMGGGQPGVTVAVRRKGTGDARGDVIATATTDRYGDFVVRTSSPVKGDVVVEFTKSNYTSLTRELHLGDDKYPPFVAETLEGNLQLVGRVVDALSSRPLAGASVRLSSMYKDWHAETDDGGRFTMKGVFPGKGELVVQAKGYGRERQAVPKLDDPDEHVVKLKPERIVHIKTLDEKKQTITGVTIECYDGERDNFRTAVTNRDGSSTFRGLHFDTATLNIRLTHEDYVSGEDFDRNIDLPGGKPESSHELVMERAGRIGGVITDAETHKPLYGVRVITGHGFSDTSPRDWTNYKGAYTLNGIKPGAAAATAHLSGYAPELKTVEVKPGETTRLDFQLRLGATLRGIVKSASGEPVPGAFVETGRWRKHESLDLRAMTDENGVFVIESAPHDEFEIIVGAVRTPNVTKMVKADSTAPVEIILPDVQLPPGASSASRLKLGEPVPEFEMTTLTGKTVTLAGLKGKVILLDFWATWCAPCVADLPKLLEVNNRFGGRDDFVMLSVSLDWDEQRLRDFVKERKMTWHQVFGETTGTQTATTRYGVTGVPAVFLIAGDGKLIASDLTAEAILRVIQETLKDKTGK